MPDSPTNGTSAQGQSPQASDGEVLEALRSLIVGPEQMQLRMLQARLDSLTVSAEDVSSVLPEAIQLRSQQDNLLTSAMRGTVEEAMQASVRRNPRILLDVIFPLIGPAIRKALASALRSMIDSLNRSLDVSISLQGVKWRLQALRTGKPFAEVVLLHTLSFRVEQVFLIHRETGLLLQHVTANAVTPQDGDLVSGMLTAIQSFIQDSFGVEASEGLETVRIGDLTVWIEQGPLGIVAAVVRGDGPQELRTAFQEAVEMIHLEQQGPLHAFRGDAAPFAASRPHLEACLLTQYKPRERRISLVFWIICAVILGGLGLWSWGAIRDHQRWLGYMETLRTAPGIVVTLAEKQGGKYMLAGLRDPLAVDPQQLLQQAGLDPAHMISRWEPYQALHRPFVLRRAQTLLAPPDTVHLSLDNGVLYATGAAPHGWIVEAERLARMSPGIETFQHDQLIDTTLAELAALTQQIEQSTLLFRKGMAQLVTGQEDALQRLITTMHTLYDVARAIPVQAHVNILGHTDATGGEGKNIDLSQERADRILSALAAQGITKASLTALGIGSRKLLVDEATEEDRALNRRVSFQVNLSAIVTK
jgi:outer membrane protein OmpA-like peptidoglycan-associated protein